MWAGVRLFRSDQIMLDQEIFWTHYCINCLHSPHLTRAEWTWTTKDCYWRKTQRKIRFLTKHIRSEKCALEAETKFIVHENCVSLRATNNQKTHLLQLRWIQTGKTHFNCNFKWSHTTMRIKWIILLLLPPSEHWNNLPSARAQVQNNFHVANFTDTVDNGQSWNKTKTAIQYYNHWNKTAKTEQQVQ